MPALKPYHVLPVRAIQLILIFPYMITLERSRDRYIRRGVQDSDVVIGQLTAIASAFWAMSTIYLTKFRSIEEDEEEGETAKSRTRRAMGALAHETTFLGFWIASAVLSRGDALGFAITETVLFGISTFMLFFQHNVWQHMRGQRVEAQRPLRLGRESAGVRASEGLDRDANEIGVERMPRESLDSGFGDLPSAEEGKTLLA